MALDASSVSAATSEFDAFSSYARNIIAEQLRQLPVVPISGPLPQVPLRATAETAPEAKVGILGAGVGGLYAGIMLRSLDIPFEILEASDRVGGRVFTHEFSKEKHDYYDVGAMRFPKTNVMRRLFHLFEHPLLNNPEDKLDLKSHVIPYLFQDQDTEGKSFLSFNGITVRRSDPTTFDFQVTGVPEEALSKGSDAILADVYDIFVEAFQNDIKNRPPTKLGWKLLMQFDKYSTRNFMALNHGLSQPTINWLETRSAGTGWFDQAFAESVLEYISFGGGEQNVEWKCLDGGSQVLPFTMKSYLDIHAPKAVQTEKFVKKIENLVIIQDTKATNSEENKPSERIEVTVEGEEKPRRYSHVISTIPLPVLRTLDIDNAGLTIGQTNALRQLQYGPSVKIGVKFKSQWWTDKLRIIGGQTYSDRCIRTTVYPSYGIGSESKTKVLIVSYTWSSDAHRFSALINSPAGMEEQAKNRLKELVLRDLAYVHHDQVDYATLLKEYDDHFSWDWNNNPLSQGAFAFFGPGEFSTLYKELTGAAADGYLHFAGEALSIRHAWIVGALDSAWRAVAEVLTVSYPDKVKQFEKEWGYCEEWVAPADDFAGWGAKAPTMKASLLASHLAFKHPNAVI